jgi:peptide/nickel transport system permease protein
LNLVRFLGNRLLAIVPVLIGISLIAFLMLRFIPGDPAQIILGTHATPERVAELRAQLGLNEPLWRQYLSFLANALRGNLGVSLVAQRAVLAVAIERLPVTLFLIAYAVILSLMVTIPLAMLAGLNRGTLVDQMIRGVFMLALAMPGFWVGILLILVFAVRYRLFPVAGFGRSLTDTLWHLFLPALTIALSLAAILIRNLRSGVIDVLKAPYIEFARAKGLRESLVLGRHVLRNALISSVTILGLNIGYLIGGSVVVETVFSLPGLGSLMVASIFARDYPVVQGLTLIFGVLVILVNLLTDVVYASLDPRVSYA